MKEQKTKDSQSHYEQKIRIKLNGNHNSTLNLKLHYKEVIIKKCIQHRNGRLDQWNGM